ncbi:MAG: alpha/beta fold hydrolase [Pseudomonadota bacterium]
MVTRLLAWVLALQLAVIGAVAWALSAHWPGAGLVAAGVAAAALVLLLRLAITANNFWLSWRARSETPAEHALGLDARLRLFCGEFYATMLASSWHMLRGGHALHLGGSATLPVLLVHGYGCNSGYWSGLSALLRRRGVSYLALDLEPVMAGIDDYAPLLEAALHRLCAASGAPRAIVVAHSMGGLAARAYLRRYGAARLARVITLGTPHHGTALAGFGPGENARQMRRDSPWLQALAASETAPTRALFTSLWSHHDNIIAPQDSSHLPGARNVEFGGIGHVALGRAPQIQQAVLDEIEQISQLRHTMDSAGFVR